MDYKKKLVDKIEMFYVDIVEEFKEAELQIMADSKFTSIFKKKDYDGNIRKLRLCKKQALAVNTDEKGIPEGDKIAREVVRDFEKCLMLFNNLCDSYIQLQLSQKKKAEKEPLKFSEYKEIFNKVQASRAALNDALHDLDIVYTDYTYDENEDPYVFLD